ncbi:MAG: hypothetical protein KDA85_21270, partial [Planctomycetaceae bacterium]|nr:hypothetical protein [Planctomycetaceae bacterium]
VGDVPPDQIDEGVWNAIETAVADHGLTILFIPGRRSFPHDYHSTVLDGLLPVESGRQRLAEDLQRSVAETAPSSFHLSVTAAGRQLPMFQLTDPETGVPVSLNELPGHPWIYAVTPRPTATSWATAELGGTVLPEETVIAVQDYGFGQVIWMGTDSTWRWRRRRGDSVHHQFWGQLIRWAARHRNASGNDQVRMAMTHAIATDVDDVGVTLHWNKQLTADLAGANISLQVTRVGDDQSSPVSPSEPSTSDLQHSIPVVPDEADPARAELTLPRLTPGRWQVELLVANAAFRLSEPIRADLLVQRQPSAELANMSCDRDFLQQLASLSRGQMLEPYQLDRLIQQVSPTSEDRRLLQERTLWDHWTIVVLFFALLMTEWCVRKLSGLP